MPEMQTPILTFFYPTLLPKMQHPVIVSVSFSHDHAVTVSCIDLLKKTSHVCSSYEDTVSADQNV